jgi:hypothetical protein
MISKCDQEGCTGHLGKFSSCLDEAVWELSLDTVMDRETGRTEAHGHFTVMTFHADEEHKIQHGATVIIPAGWYLVEENDQGFVWVVSYDNEADMIKVFDEHDQRYGEWLDANEPE